MSLAAKIILAIGLVLLGFAGGIKWHAGQDAIAANKAAEARQADARRQRHQNDMAAGEHAARLANLQTQLGDARVQIQNLPGRDCLGPDVVRMLNDINSQPVRTAASEPAGAASAPASGAGLRYSTDRDAGNALAICRARFGEVADQVNSILDIEEHRQKATP